MYGGIYEDRRKIRRSHGDTWKYIRKVNQQEQLAIIASHGPYTYGICTVAVLRAHTVDYAPLSK